MILIHKLIKFIHKKEKTLFSFFKFRFLVCIAGVIIINLLPLKAGNIGASRKDPAAAHLPSAMIEISPPRRRPRRRRVVPTAPPESMDPIGRRRVVPTPPPESMDPIVRVQDGTDLPNSNRIFSTPLFTSRVFSTPLFTSRVLPRLLGTEIFSMRLFSRRIFSTHFVSPRISLFFTSGIYSCRVEETRFFLVSCRCFINFSIET